MNFAKATNFNRKSGVAEGSAVHLNQQQIYLFEISRAMIKR